MRVTIVDDLDECRFLWQQAVPAENLFDLWEVRACFQRQYGYRPCFVVASSDQRIKGLLPLSDIDEHAYWGYFPGETFHGKTWLEQNRVIADGSDTMRALLSVCPTSTHMRYLPVDPLLSSWGARPDEVGYLFYPSDHDYCFDRYLGTFSKNSRKPLRRERERLEALGISYRHNITDDIDTLFSLNINAFGASSYFADSRFLAAFQDLAKMLWDDGRLRITTLLIGGQAAAVDIGAVYRGVYTVLAGGTDPAFPGVAKLINFHHLEWACRERIDMVDFLCGDFGWKSRFHLTARPLYQMGMIPSCVGTSEYREDPLIEVA